MDERTRDPLQIRAEDINPRYNWGRALPSLGTMGVDFEERVDYRRLHRFRLGRAKQALEKSECGALLVFDVNNIRYLTSTKIGEWERDKMCALGTAHPQRRSDPVGLRFGRRPSQALYAVAQAGELQGRHARPARHGRSLVRADGQARQGIVSLLKEAGVREDAGRRRHHRAAMMFELQKAGVNVVDGQQLMLEARELKSQDEIALLNRAAAMVDGAYHMVSEELKPGVRENDIVAKVNEFLYRHGSDDVEAVNAISGERCNPHPHNFTDRMIRPGDQAFFDILQSFMGYRTCYYRTFNVGRATPRNTTPTRSAANGSIAPSS